MSKPLLERVFPVVYGVELKDVLTHEDLAVGSYRFAVSRLMPQMTRVALQTHKKELMHETPNFAKRKFLYRLSRSSCAIEVLKQQHYIKEFSVQGRLPDAEQLRCLFCAAAVYSFENGVTL